MPPWSYSGLTAFESCPRKYFHLKVERSVVEPSSEHATHGVAVHQALEYAVAGTAPLPEKYLEWLPLVQKLGLAAHLPAWRRNTAPQQARGTPPRRRPPAPKWCRRMLRLQPE